MVARSAGVPRPPSRGPDRLLRPDARARRPRRRRPGPPAGDPLERPAHGRRVRRDRAARRARAADRADRQPRADRVHGAEAALATHARARRLRADPPHAAAEGLRPLPADRRACDRRCRRIGHAALRRRAAPLVGGGVRGARGAARLAAARARVDGDRRRGRSGGGGARGRHRHTRAGLGRARHVGRRLRRAARPTRPTPRRACTSSATRSRAPGTRWA